MTTVLVRRLCLLKGDITLNNSIMVPFSTSCLRFLDRKWRKERSLPENPTSFGPLTNLPDFTYKDGRPTPLGSRQKKRLMKQREYVETIIRLTKEIDFAVDRNERLTRKEEERRQKILSSKLKPKGNQLLQPPQ